MKDAEKGVQEAKEEATLLTQKLSEWSEVFIGMLPNLALAVLVMVVFWLAAKLGRKLTGKGLSRLSDNTQIVRLLSTVVYVVIWLAGLFVALGVLDLDKTVTSLLAGMGIVGLALGFAFQDLAANFMAGIVMAFRRPFSIGDIVETNDFMGKVKATDLRSTIVETFQGQHVLIPNKQVFDNPIVNYSQPSGRRVDLSAGVSYDDDLEQVKNVALKAIENVEVRDKDREPSFYFEEFGDSSINFTIRFWTDYPQQDFLEARSQAVMALKKAFDENGISIPFPIRTVDFGIRGGLRLDEVYPPGDRANRQAGNGEGSGSPEKNGTNGKASSEQDGVSATAGAERDS